MPVMGTVLEERTVHNPQNELLSFHRTETKAFVPRKKNTKTSLSHPNNSQLSADPHCQQRLGRTRPDKTLIVADSPARQHNSKIKSHVSSKNGQERHQKQISNGQKNCDSTSGLQPVQRIPVIQQRKESSEHKTEVEDTAEDSDSASDLSDSERCSKLPPQIAPPDLNLRAEVIDSSDLHPSRLACRGRTNSGGSYPDFLPPPFNSWSLKQLAVYLNTDGKGISRPKAVGKLERYLDRLLQMEWHQIQTVQEESSKSNGPMPKCRHTSSQSSLSSPKCILQCQRAFSLALLACLTNVPTLQLPSCTCPHCKRRYPISYIYHHTHSPLVEKRGQTSGFPKRSCSESRAHQFEKREKTHEHRLSDPLSDSSHLKRMQAIGNIRNPVGTTNNPKEISAITASTASLDNVKIKTSERRTHYCGGMRQAGYKSRGRSEQIKTFDKTKQDSDLSGAISSVCLHTSSLKDSVTDRLNRKQKRVEFVTK